MKELTGQVVAWNPDTGRGLIDGDDGERYPFTTQEWADRDHDPTIGGNVLVICANGRDASHIEYLLIEHVRSMTITTHGPAGPSVFSRSRMPGGPWRMYSDALAWMEAARGLHDAVSSLEFADISDLLSGQHLPISLRGSVIKYCYGFAIELYLKWILSEAGLKYRTDHKVTKLVNKMKERRIFGKLEERYAGFMNTKNPSLIIRRAHVHGIEEVPLDWSTFEMFVQNINGMKFILGRYGTMQQYSIFDTASQQRSHEMNTYMDSQDFFTLGSHLLAYIPPPSDYDTL